MNYAIILTTLIKYYVNLLIVQYHDKPKAKAIIELLIKQIWADMILYKIRDGFDWKKSKGRQLEIIGKWVGVSKFYNGQLLFLHPWFSLIDWNSTPDNLQGGFSTFETFNTLDGGIIDYSTIQPTQNQLSDEAYSMMIGLKIIKNNINHTAKNIDNAVWDFFNGEVYTVWNENKLIYYYKADLREVMQAALLKDVLPSPTGVSIELREITE